MKSYDVVIIGGGPGGSTLGALLSKRGISNAIIEKEVFPRFRIGESLLPMSMDILRETGVYDKIANSGKYMNKYGAQFIDHRHNEEVLFDFETNRNPLHSMAFEVQRAKFDHDLLDHAVECGSALYQPEKVENVEFHEDSVTVDTGKQKFQAKYLADASGRISFLGTKYKMRQPHLDLINNFAVFAHFENVKRKPGRREGDIIIGILPNQAWSWTIPFRGNITSVGIVTSSKLIDRNNLEDFIEKSLRCTPLLADSMKDAKRVSEVQMISNYSHTNEKLVGERWISVGDAGVFLDPIFSSGVHMSMSAGSMATKVIAEALGQSLKLSKPGLGDVYEATMRRGTKRFHSMIRRFYDTEFVQDMKKTQTLPNALGAFTAIVAGDVWNDDNPVFKMGAL
jgi:flavin-dependent dehydrogenase